MASKFLYLYSGGGRPASEAEGKAMMGAWMAYYGKLGKAIVDGGAPFAPGSKTIGKASASHASGYTIVEANSLADAVAMTDGHPHVAHGGGIEVFEFASMPGM